jgi:ArsR family metal-binding transcriptional regulator
LTLYTGEILKKTNLIVFSSTHHLIHAEYTLKKEKIPIALHPAPPEFEESCLTAIAFPPDFREDVEAALDKNRIEFKGIYSFDPKRLQKLEELIEKGISRKSANQALLGRIHLCKVELCIADPDKIRIFADFSSDVSEVMPYLNRVLPYATYSDRKKTITFMQKATLVTIYSDRLAAAKVEDEEDAVLLLEWVRDLINDTYEKRGQIEPSYEQTVRLNPIELYKLLPGTNCQDCRELTCLAFAVKVLSAEAEITRCTPLVGIESSENREIVFQLLRAMGFETEA